MRSFKFIAIAFIAILALVSAGTDATPRVLGDKVIVAFKKNDLESFKSYYITPEELKKLLKKAVKQPFQMVDDDELIDDYKTRYKDLGTKVYTRIKADGEAKGIVWNTIDPEYITYPLVEVVYGVSKADAFIHFKSEGKEYVLKLKECILVPERGWCLFGDARFEKQGKK